MLVERASASASAKAPRRWAAGEEKGARELADAETTSETEDEAAASEPEGGEKRKAPAADGRAGKRARREGEREVASEMGVIEEIYCENFMCHRRMRVVLSPHINFITGENGSGKSAIIAAIQICLGASARSTHRGKSIKNLIRHGHEGNALVRITLRNDAPEGGDAFRPDLYGQRIQVERLIRRDGSAEYRLKNEHGSLVSKQKMDLEMMLDHLNIQTENPCAILDQENAKLFLKGSPADKYKFFLQSTDLYKMRTTYSKIDEETRTIHESTLKREKIKIATLLKAMKEAEARWQEAQSIGKLEEEFSALKNELAWSFVQEKELEAEKVAKKIHLKEQQAEEAREKHSKARDYVIQLETEQKTKNEDLDEIAKRASKTHKKREERKLKIKEARRPLHSYNAELKSLSQQRDRTNQRISRLRRDIEKKKQAHEAMIQNRMHRNEEMKNRIEVKRREVQEGEHELEEAQYNMQRTPNNLEEFESRHDNCLYQLREAENEISRVNGRLSSLKAQKRDSLAVFGSRIPDLQRLIHENRHRFTEPPIGPLGLYVKLPERYMDFAVAVESALKGTLQSYLVVNGRDKAVLDDLKRRVKCPNNQANIIIAQRSGRRYGNLRVAEGSLATHAICNILEVSDPDVFNALIDVCSIESKLIFETRERGESEVLRGENGNLRMARFVSEVFMPNGDKLIVRQGNLTYIAHKGSNRSTIICHDSEAEIRELEQRLDYLQGNCEVLRRDETRLRRDREDVRNEVKRQHDNVNRLTHRLNHAKMELRNLEDDLTDDVQQHALDTTVLEDEVTEAQNELESFSEREKELNDLISKFNPDLEGMLAELEELTNLEKEINEELTTCQQEADVLLKKLSTMKAKEMRYERESSSQGDMVTQWKDELAALREDCEELSAKAKRHCGTDERVVVNHSHDYYGKRLTHIKQQIEKEKRRFEGMDLNDLLLDKEEKRVKYETKKTTFDRFRKNLNSVRSMLETRKRVWEILRKEISHRTSMEFNKFMCINDFAGKLKFRHDDQLLDIAVLHNEEGLSKASQVTDMKELSGGERSYTQVSLLLALGQSIECPFRVMDEFDVFMDSVNRDMTIQLLVDAAKRDAGKQFIFVTPNDLSALRRDPMVKIQKMDPPRDRLNAGT